MPRARVLTQEQQDERLYQQWIKQTIRSMGTWCKDCDGYKRKSTIESTFPPHRCRCAERRAQARKNTSLPPKTP